MVYATLGQMFLGQTERFAAKTAHLIPQSGKDPIPVTYGELRTQVHGFASALVGLGVQSGDRVVLQAESSADWAMCDWACQTLGVVLVPIYPTLPADQSQYIVQDCGAKLVVSQNTKQAVKMEGLTGIQVVLLSKEGDQPGLKERAQPDQLSQDAWVQGAQAAGEEDLATLIYTSGTTGVPKGVMLPHRAFTYLCADIPSCIPLKEQDVFLSFLPLSHVFERFAGHVLPMSMGATIGYVGSLASLAHDMERVKPTIMLVVPRLLESLKGRIEDGVLKAPPLRQRLFRMAQEQGLKRMRGEFAPLAGVLEGLVGSKIKAKFGGRLRYFVSGGAALPTHVSEFYLALGIHVLQGYGLTENCAAACINRPEDNRPDTVGPPLKGVEVKIAADGEILLRGRCIMQGYYNLPEDTAATLDAEGWLHTGDIGELDRGNLRITDRKKDLLVLGNGKNVAPQPIESRLKESPYINEAVLLGDGMESVVAMVVPEFERVAMWLKEKGVNLKEPEKIAVHPDVIALIKSEVQRANDGLADFERVKRHVLVPAPFTIDGGELTPSLKVRRKVVKEKYANLVDALKR